jgi:RNA polymerase sigma-70 factor, ECF subfamily
LLARCPLTGRHRWRLLTTSGNGQPAFGAYIRDPDQNSFVPHEILVLTLERARIAEITGFLSAEPFERFRLPAAVD